MKEILPTLLEEVSKFGKQQFFLNALLEYKKTIASLFCLVGYGVYNIFVTVFMWFKNVLAHIPAFVEKGETLMISHPFIALFSIIVILLVIVERY